MRLGAVYHAFNGCELLPWSIECIREHVDYLAVLWHSVSHGGDGRITDADRAAISEARKFRAEIYEFNDAENDHNRHYSQLVARNVGLGLAKANACTHFLSIDCDEMYRPDQFARAKRVAEHVDASACQCRTYYHDDAHVFDDDGSKAWVPFIVRADARWLEYDVPWPVYCDPMRKCRAGSLVVFAQDLIAMHHFSHVRRDYRSKLEHASCRQSYTQEIDRVVSHYENWSEGQPALLAIPGEVPLKKVEPFFGGRFKCASSSPASPACSAPVSPAGSETTIPPSTSSASTT